MFQVFFKAIFNYKMQGFFFSFLYRPLMAFLRNRRPHFINTYDMKNPYTAFCPFGESDSHLENFNRLAYLVELNSVKLFEQELHVVNEHAFVQLMCSF